MSQSANKSPKTARRVSGPSSIHWTAGPPLRFKSLSTPGQSVAEPGLTFAEGGGLLRSSAKTRNEESETDGKRLRNLRHPLCDHVAAHASYELSAARCA